MAYNPETTYIPSVTFAYNRLSAKERRRLLLDQYKVPLIREEIIGAVPVFRLDAAVHSPTGSFKILGATNALFSLDPQQLFRRGISVTSGGNHALSAAYAAAQYNHRLQTTTISNIPARARIHTDVFVHSGVSEEMQNKIRGIDPNTITIHVSEGYTFEDADALRIRRFGSSNSVHSTPFHIEPFNNERVIEGQGLLAHDLHDAIGDDGSAVVVVVPVGGGGLFAGLLHESAKVWPDPARRPRIIGARLATQNGHPNKFAGSAAVKDVGSLNKAIFLEHNANIVIVDPSQHATFVTQQLHSGSPTSEHAAIMAKTVAYELAMLANTQSNTPTMIYVNTGNNFNADLALQDNDAINA